MERLCSIAIEGHNAFHFGCEERSDGGVQEDVHGIYSERSSSDSCALCGIWHRNGTGLAGPVRFAEVVCIRDVYIDSVWQKSGADGVECNEKCTVKLDILSCFGISFSQAEVVHPYLP
jgi:hypothetical protein